jgi:magnesium transporter
MTQSLTPSATALLEPLRVTAGVPWFHIPDPQSHVLDDVAAELGIHPLQVEDCRERDKTAHVEDSETYSFIVIKLLGAAVTGRLRRKKGAAAAAAGVAAAPAQPQNAAYPNTRSSIADDTAEVPMRLLFEDFNLFLGADYLLTVSEGEDDSELVKAVVSRVTAKTPAKSPDRIAHAIIDIAVDRYLPVLDNVADAISDAENIVLHSPEPYILREIFRLKRMLLVFRRVASAMRDVVSQMTRRYDLTEHRTDRELRVYYRDISDHLVRVTELIETYRDLLSGTLDIYLSAIANRTNQIMKVLTIWGTISIPLVVLTGFFGMNVKLPMEQNPNAVWWLIGAMCASTAACLYLFRRMKWF